VTAVLDASLLVAALVDSGSNGAWAESVISRHAVIGPELLLVETINILRRLERSEHISTLEANSAQRDLTRLDLALYPFGPFARRIWSLRGNLTSYDAWYVALAEALDCPLATLDLKLTRASGPTCDLIIP
jgi:predicted nucleic acid-binding protein